MSRRRFGSVITRTSREGRQWLEARYTPTAGLRAQWPTLPRRVVRTFPVGWDLQAEQWLTDEEKLIRLGTWTPPDQRRTKRKADGMTFREYADKWLEDPRRRQTTRDKYREAIDNHLLETFGDRPLTAITPRMVDDWYHSYPIGSNGEGSTQRHNTYTLLKGILRAAATRPMDAEGDTLIDRSPALTASRRPRRRHQPVIAELDELRQVMAAMPERLRATVMLGGVMGLREGEVCGLRRCDIDLESDPPQLHVRKAVKGVKNPDGSRRLVLGETKTPASMRDLDIPESLLPMIRERLRYAGKGPHALLFPGRGGKGMLAPQSLRNEFDKARAKVPRLQRMHFHDLRDTALTRLAEMGATGGELMAQAGHTSLKVAAVYQRASASHKREVMKRLDEAIADRPEEPGESKPAPPAVDLVGRLEKLADLRARGLLSDEEFAKAKTRLLEE